MSETNQTPEEVKNTRPAGNFAIKNAKKFESISEKMKKILESSEKLPQIPTRNLTSSVPKREVTTPNPIDTKALKDAMDGLTQFHDIFKEDQDLSDEIAQTNDALFKMNDNFKGMTEIQTLQLKTLQSMLIEQAEARSTSKKYFLLNVLVAVLSVAAIIIYFKTNTDDSAKTAPTATSNPYLGPLLPAEPVQQKFYTPAQ